MNQSQFTSAEAYRLEALRRYEVLDTPPDAAFDCITRLAANVFGTPISLLGFVDEDRVWLKSAHGVALDEMERFPGLCASAIASAKTYVIENAAIDARTEGHPLVAGAFGLRFYAAAPLVTHDGYHIGTLSVIDHVPRALSVEEREMLSLMATIAMEHLERRLAAREIVASFKALMSATESSAQHVSVCAWSNRIKIGSNWLSFEEFLSEHMGWKVCHELHPDISSEIIDNLK